MKKTFFVFAAFFLALNFSHSQTTDNADSIPDVRVLIPSNAYVREITVFNAWLQRGSIQQLTYTWYSSLTGQSLMGDTVHLVYNSGGVDTIKLVACNAYGRDSLIQIVNVYDCPDVITEHPWFVDFGTDYDCWRPIGNQGWTRYTYNGNKGIHASKNGNPMITSPAVVLPMDTLGLRLYWKDITGPFSDHNGIYYVLVSTTNRFDRTSYDTVFSGLAGSDAVLTQRSVSLANYAGDTVYIAFCQKNNSYYEYMIFITGVAIYNSLAPLASFQYPEYSPAVGDTAHFSIVLTQGENTTMTYSWHSDYFDTTIINNNPVLDLVYPSEGADTISVTVSNAYGSMSFRKNFRVFYCDTIRDFPWMEDFRELGYEASYNTCWQIDGLFQDGWTFHYMDEDSNEVLLTNRFRGIGSMILPYINIPSTGAQRLKLWLYHDRNLTAVVSTDGGYSFTDTIYSENHSGMWLRSVPLCRFAGQTILVKLYAEEYCFISQIGVDYDSVLRVNIKHPNRVFVDTTVLCTATLRFGDTVGLAFSWHSSIGGTFVTNISGDSAWVTYPAGVGTANDIISVTASNTYNSDMATGTIRVVDCTPAINFPWRETFEDNLICWYKPNGSNWGESYQRLTSSCRGASVPQWIMSKEIHIPSDTSLYLALLWDVATSNSDYSYNYSIWVSTGGDYTDTSNYELFYLDTISHVRINNFDHLQALLSDYAGDTIHFAFRNMPSGSNARYLYIDNVVVRSIAPPVVDINVPTDIYTGDQVCNAEATIIEGLSYGLTYSWRSTMLDTVVNDLLFPLAYSTSGTDTLTFIIANNYGSDTITRIVQVHYCPAIASFPFEEPFELEETLMCWRDWNLLANPDTSINYSWRLMFFDNRSVISNFAEDSLYPNPWHFYESTSFNSWLVTPAITMPAVADGINIDFDVRSSMDGYGYIDTKLKVLLSTNGGASPEYFTDILNSSKINPSVWTHIHIPLNDYAGQTINIAFVNSNFTSGVHIDSLYIGYTYLPQVSISHSEAYMGDTTNFYAVNNNCVIDNLTVEWHSSLLDTTFQSGIYNFDIVYPYAGIDTITLVVSNLYGSDTAIAVFEVLAHPLPMTSIVAPTSAIAGDSVFFSATINDCSRNGLTYYWHSSLLGQTVFDTLWSVVYPYGGMDTVTFVVSNIFGADSASVIYYVYDCSGSVLPYYETFEHFAADFHSLPDCWTVSSNGNAESVIPHVYTYSGYPGKVLMMSAGNNTNYSYYGTLVQAILPKFSRPLQELSLSLDYIYENVNKGCLIIGSYNDSLNLFTPLDTLTPYSASMIRDNLSFSNFDADSNDRIAIRWTRKGDVVSAYVDNILVRGLPNVTINGPSTVALGDNVSYSASITEITDSVTSVNWNSAMQSRGDATIIVDEDALLVNYSEVGVDTLSITITTNIDTVTAFYTVDVLNMTPVASIQTEGQITRCDTIVAIVNYERFKDVIYNVRWYSRMADVGMAEMIPVGDTLRIVYQNEGIDTISAAVENVYGIDSVWQFVLINECDTIWRTVTASIVMLNGGEVPAGLSIIGTGNYPDSTMVTLAAQYPDGITFMYWITPTYDTIGDNPYVFMITDDIEITAVLQNVQGVDNANLSPELLIYPNPATSAINMVASKPGILTFFDQTGRIVAKLNVNQSVSTIDVSHFISGVYILCFISESGSYISKLIVTRP